MEEGPDSYAGMPRIALLERAQEISSMEEISWAPSQEAQEISAMEEISWALSSVPLPMDFGLPPCIQWNLIRCVIMQLSDVFCKHQK